MVSKRSCYSGTKIILCRVLENNYQQLIPLRRVIGAWENMASVQTPFLVSAAPRAMSPPLILFSVVLVYFRRIVSGIVELRVG